MKTTRTSLAAISMIAALALAAPAVRAEEEPPAPAAEAPAEPTFPDWIQKEIDKISAAIPDLTADQKTQIADAFKTRTEALASIRDTGGTEEETMDAWSAYVRTVNGILTPEQFLKFQELMKPKSSTPDE